MMLDSMPTSDDPRWPERLAMVQEQLTARGIRDQRVLAAMVAVPRHEFVSPDTYSAAYGDQALPIDCGQTISQPFVVALMCEALHLSGNERVLEIGTGTGYSTAILSLLAREVFSVERLPELAAAAAHRLNRLGYDNVRVVCADGTLGLPEQAPFDAIVIAAAAPSVPEPLTRQLVNGGRLVAPVGDRSDQQLVRVVCQDAALQTTQLGHVRFIPLIGTFGWHEASGS